MITEVPSTTTPSPNPSSELREHDGLKFRLRTCDEVVFDDNIVRRQHLRHTTIEEGEIWLDVGAYVGTFALLAAQHKAKVVAFEPDPRSRECLKENIVLNDAVRQVRVSPRAVLTEAGKVPLFLNDQAGNPAANSTINRWKREHPTELVQAIDFAEAVSLARRAHGEGPLCLKIDIEGAEIPILETFDFSEFSKLIVEYHFHADPNVGRMRQILARLEQQGFEIHLEHKLPTQEEWPNPRKKFMTFWAHRGATESDSTPESIETESETAKVTPARTRGAIAEILPGLYQRGHFLTWPLERKRSALASLNIDVVVNLWNKVDPDMSSLRLIYLNWPIDGDTVPPDLETMTIMLIRLLEKGRSVLVHCEAGRNRSAFICAAIIARMRGCSGTDALEIVHAAQPRIKLNRNLQRYLELELT